MAQLLSACSHMHTYDECMSGEEKDKYTSDILCTKVGLCLQRRRNKNDKYM